MSHDNYMIIIIIIISFSYYHYHLSSKREEYMNFDD
jgi:hypothetical protein